MRNLGIKKAETLSQSFGLHLPMKTTLLVRAVYINSKAMPIAQNLNLNGKLCLISNRLFFDVEFPPIVWEIFTQIGNMWNGFD